MKRAEVWRSQLGWAAATFPDSEPDRSVRILARPTAGLVFIREEPFPTHAAALAHALAEVGLTEKKENAS